MVETIEYEIIRKVGKVEIRRYPKIVIAKVDNPQTDAFNLLYTYITGENKQQSKVKMTAPVMSQKIAMTSPVFSESDSMAFVMPKEFTLETTPEPLDERVKIAEVPARLVAALRFSGGWSGEHFEKKTQELLNALVEAKIKLKGQVFTMLYNPPFIPGFLRRNEVAVEVETPDEPSNPHLQPRFSIALSGCLDFF
ncbi:MAG: heme-binding protein [Candidatus Bathyarchaeota archaeon]|nr:heme-binding protein [Candidatus Bathyarchaeota archaeon]